MNIDCFVLFLVVLVLTNSWCNNPGVTYKLLNMVAFGPDQPGWRAARSLYVTQKQKNPKLLVVNVCFSGW